MRIYTAMVPSADSGEIWKVDAIEYQGAFWLVPTWLESQAEQCRRPERIIPILRLAHQRLPAGSPFGDFLLLEPLPKAVLYAPLQSAIGEQYGAIPLPPIAFPWGGSTH